MLDFFSHSNASAAKLTIRLSRIEQKLDLILNHLGLKFTELTVLPGEARALAEKGDTIGAIKLLREATGFSLAEAKSEVERYLAGRA